MEAQIGKVYRSKGEPRVKVFDVYPDHQPPLPTWYAVVPRGAAVHSEWIVSGRNEDLMEELA